MKCLFCPKDLGLTTIKKCRRHCKNCKIWYNLGEGTIQSYIILGIHKERFYLAEFKITEPVKFVLAEPDTNDDKIQRLGKPIVEMDYLPKIDQSNFSTKIPTLINFS